MRDAGLSAIGCREHGEAGSWEGAVLSCADLRLGMTSPSHASAHGTLPLREAE